MQRHFLYSKNSSVWVTKSFGEKFVVEDAFTCVPFSYVPSYVNGPTPSHTTPPDPLIIEEKGAGIDAHRIERLAAFRLFLLDETKQVYLWCLGVSMPTGNLGSRANFANAAEYDKLVCHWKETIHEEKIMLGTLEKISISVHTQQVWTCKFCLHLFITNDIYERTIPVCTNCFDHVANSIGNVREEQVQREFTGVVAGIVEDEGHDEMVARQMAIRKAELVYREAHDGQK